MKSAVLLVLLGVVGHVSGHGYMTSPRTRVRVAFENQMEWCPHCVLWDVVAGLEPYAGRPWPGHRPFAQPGEGISEIGPCGKNGGNDFNKPSGPWGAVVGTFSPGQIVETEWYAQADHLGVYSYRVCQNDELVARFLNPGYTPNQSDYDNIEKCLQDGILPCNAPGLNNQNCASPQTSFECDPSWGCNNPEWFGQMRSTEFYRDRIRIPDFRSNHTLLTWRWDAHDTPQLYLNCVDIRIA